MSKKTPLITKDFCEDNILLFFPKTEKEAAEIQRKLFEVGNFLGVSSNFFGRCVEYGMTLGKNGYICYNPCDESRKNGVTCTLEDFYTNSSWVEHDAAAVKKAVKSVMNLSSYDREKVLTELKSKASNEFKKVAYVNEAAKVKRNLPISKPLSFKKKKN